MDWALKIAGVKHWPIWWPVFAVWAKYTIENILVLKDTLVLLAMQ